MSCTFTAGCPLYPTVSRLAELAYWLDHYCRGESERCERLHRSLAQGAAQSEDRACQEGAAGGSGGRA